MSSMRLDVRDGVVLLVYDPSGQHVACLPSWVTWCRSSSTRSLVSSKRVICNEGENALMLYASDNNELSVPGAATVLSASMSSIAGSSMCRYENHIRDDVSTASGSSGPTPACVLYMLSVLAPLSSRMAVLGPNRNSALLRAVASNHGIDLWSVCKVHLRTSRQSH